VPTSRRSNSALPPDGFAVGVEAVARVPWRRPGRRA
jgi:hypothetical protein